MSIIIAHGAANAFFALFPFIIAIDGIIQTRFWIYCILSLIVGIIVLILRINKSKNNGT